MTVYSNPGTPGALVSFKPRYENWIGGEWVKPVKGQYFEDISPVNGKPFAEVARGTAEDIELALDAAHRAAPAWGKTSGAERAAVLNTIADIIDANLELLSVAETCSIRLIAAESLPSAETAVIETFHTSRSSPTPVDRKSARSAAPCAGRAGQPNRTRIMCGVSQVRSRTSARK